MVRAILGQHPIMAKPKYKILIVDDEEDIHRVTKLGLRGLKYKGKRCEFLSAMNGKEAVIMVQDNPDIAVMLLDVVMESDDAGLAACRFIREELGNNFVRIILRTGQPGMSPEKETIDNYDIDGYMSKTEITSNRLYSSIRTGLKAWNELMDLERHKASLSLIHDCAMSVHSFDPMESSLDRILEAAATISGARMAVLSLETFDESEVPSGYVMHLAPQDDDIKERVAYITRGINQRTGRGQTADTLSLENGVVFPFALHRELGHGWIYLESVDLDELQMQALALLCGHASNALYSTVAQRLLNSRQDQADDFDVMAI